MSKSSLPEFFCTAREFRCGAEGLLLVRNLRCFSQCVPMACFPPGFESEDLPAHAVKLYGPHNISNLLTIPVHAACNRAWQEDEEYFVHTLLPMTRGSEAGDAHHVRIRQKMKAGKNVALVNEVMDEFKSVIGGVYLPANRVAKLIDHRRAFGVIWKIIRGLYFHHTGIILPVEWGMRYWITAPYEEPEEFFKQYAESGRGVPRGEYPQIFSYFFDRFQPDGWDFHFWGFHLWDSLIVTAMFHDPSGCGCPECIFVGPQFPEPMEGIIRHAKRLSACLKVP